VPKDKPPRAYEQIGEAVKTDLNGTVREIELDPAIGSGDFSQPPCQQAVCQVRIISGSQTSGG